MMARPKLPRCSVRGCKKRIAAAGLCNTHLMRKADQAFSRYIRERDGACQRCAERDGLQCAHIVSRRYRVTRWDEDNAMALCMRCHVYFTHRPLEWENFIDAEWDYFWFELRKRALVTDPPDWKELAVPWVERLMIAAGEVEP